MGSMGLAGPGGGALSTMALALSGVVLSGLPSIVVFTLCGNAKKYETYVTSGSIGMEGVRDRGREEGVRDRGREGVRDRGRERGL